MWDNKTISRIAWVISVFIRQIYKNVLQEKSKVWQTLLEGFVPFSFYGLRYKNGKKTSLRYGSQKFLKDSEVSFKIALIYLSRTQLYRSSSTYQMFF